MNENSMTVSVEGCFGSALLKAARKPDFQIILQIGDARIVCSREAVKSKTGAVRLTLVDEEIVRTAMRLEQERRPAATHVPLSALVSGMGKLGFTEQFKYEKTTWTELFESLDFCQLTWDDTFTPAVANVGLLPLQVGTVTSVKPAFAFLRMEDGKNCFVHSSSFQTQDWPPMVGDRFAGYVRPTHKGHDGFRMSRVSA